MLESLVESSFFADSRLGSFLRSVASKETANWDVDSGKYGVFPCAPPAFSRPAANCGRRRQVPRRARLRSVEQQLTGLIISVLSFQVLGRPKTAPASCRMGGTRNSLQKKAVASVGARVRAFVRDTAAVQIDGSSGRKAESTLTFLDNVVQRELNSIYTAKATTVRDLELVACARSYLSGLIFRRKRALSRSLDISHALQLISACLSGC